MNRRRWLVGAFTVIGTAALSACGRIGQSPVVQQAYLGMAAEEPA